jgi:hypothetical protein
MQALYAALGHSFPADNYFALLYVMYNPVCREDINRKKLLFAKLLAEAMYPIHKEYLGRGKNLRFYIKSGWAMLKFAVKNRALADCNPTLVLAASQQPHAALLKDINRLLMLANSQDRDATMNRDISMAKVLSKMKAAKLFLGKPIVLHTGVASSEHGHLRNKSRHADVNIPWIEKIKNCWKRSNKIVPMNPGDPQRYEDAPKQFVDSFALKRQFVEANIAEKARVSLLTMMIFTEVDDFGSTKDCKLYRHGFESNLASFRQAFRALFVLSKSLESIDSSEKIMLLSLQKRLFLRASELIFGEDWKLLRNFHLLSDKETAELFQLHDFSELHVTDFSMLSVDAVLKQMLEADEQKLHCASTNGTQALSKPVNDESFPNMLHISSSIGSSSQLHSVNAAHKRDAYPKSSTAVSIPSGFAVMRPSVISSKKLLSSARSGIQMNSAAGDMDDSAPTEDERTAEVKSEASKVYSSKISLVAVTASGDPVESPSHGSDEYQVSVARKISVDIGGEHIDSAAAKLSTATAELDIQAFTRDINEISFAPALMQRAAATDAAAKLSAVEIAKLTAQVEDLQASIQAHKVPKAISNDTLTSALQRAAVAEANVETLTSQLNDLQAASDAAAKLSAVEIAKLTAQVEDLQASIQAHKVPQAKSNDTLTSALQRAAVAEANVETLTSQLNDLQAASDAAAKLPAVEIAKLKAQVEDAQAATQTHNAPQTKSNDTSTSALQRAAVAAANVQTLTLRVNDLQAASVAKAKLWRTVSFKKVRSVVFKHLLHACVTVPTFN